MPRGTLLISNVTAGEMSPLASGRVDLARYPNAAEIMVNRLIRTQGAHDLRPGLQFIAEAKDSSKRVRLIGFKFSTVQAYILECGDKYFRFFKDKGQIFSGGNPYEIVSGYAEANLFELYFNQSNDIFFITHTDYPTQKLSRYGHADWRLAQIEFIDGPYLDQNTTPTTLTPSGTTGAITLTAAPAGAELVQNGDFTEQMGSTLLNYEYGWTHDDSWTFANPYAQHVAGSITALSQPLLPAIAGKSYIVVFTIAGRTVGSLTPKVGGQDGTVRSSNSTFTETIVASADGGLYFTPSSDFDGYLDDVSVKEVAASLVFFLPGHVGSYWRLKHGSTWGYVKVTEFTDSTHVKAQVKSDLGGTGATAEWREGAWSAVRGYPRCSVFHGGRQIFAGSKYQPETLWGSKVGDYPNFAPEDPITDNGPWTRTLDADDVNTILWIISGRRLMAGSVSAEWKISGTGVSGVITPADIDAIKDTNFGSSAVRAIQAGMAVLFLQQHGRKVRAQAYDFASDAYQATDLTDWSEHITRPGIVEMALQQEPEQILWSVRSDGVLLPMIFEPAEKVIGWGRVLTAGLFESVAVIPGVNQSEVWTLVNRNIGGQTKRYIECFKDMEWGTNRADCFFVDSGLSYDGTPITMIGGLDHLEEEEVAILADGQVQTRQVVSGGYITLATAASKIHVGLPYQGIYKSPRLEAAQAEGTAQGKVKKIDKLTLRLLQSWGGQAGPDEDNLEDIEYEEAVSGLFTGDKKVDFRGGYETSGQVMVIQNDPLPLTICAVVPELTTIDEGE